MLTFLLRDVIRIFLWGTTGLGLFVVGLWIWGFWHDEWSGYNASTEISDGYCNIAVLPVLGDIYVDQPSHDGSTYAAVANADEVVAFLRAAEYDPNIVGVLVRIDSLGGTPAASELIANALKRSPLYSAAVIREYGTSGGYLVATGADTIYASAFSDVGGIGMTMSYLDNTEQNENSGLKFVPLSSAPFKDYGSPDKPLTEEERELLERDLGIYHEHFVNLVAENRALPVEEVKAIADGSSVPGSLALEKKLIDAIGDQESARDWFAEQLGAAREDIVYCE